MDAINAVVRNGRVETDEPIDLPDGTRLVVRPADDDDVEDGWDNSPEGIAAWLKWYDSLEPLIFTPEEQKALEEDRKARKAWELAHADERHEKLRRLWE
jgi:hypothetical protein